MEEVETESSVRTQPPTLTDGQTGSTSTHRHQHRHRHRHPTRTRTRTRKRHSTDLLLFLLLLCFYFCFLAVTMAAVAVPHQLRLASFIHLSSICTVYVHATSEGDADTTVKLPGGRSSYCTLSPRPCSLTSCFRACSNGPTFTTHNYSDTRALTLQSHNQPGDPSLDGIILVIHFILHA